MKPLNLGLDVPTHKQTVVSARGAAQSSFAPLSDRETVVMLAMRTSEPEYDEQDEDVNDDSDDQLQDERSLKQPLGDVFQYERMTTPQTVSQPTRRGEKLMLLLCEADSNHDVSSRDFVDESPRQNPHQAVNEVSPERRHGLPHDHAYVNLKELGRERLCCEQPLIKGSDLKK